MCRSHHYDRKKGCKGSQLDPEFYIEGELLSLGERPCLYEQQPQGVYGCESVCNRPLMKTQVNDSVSSTYFSSALASGITDGAGDFRMRRMMTMRPRKKRDGAAITVDAVTASAQSTSHMAALNASSSNGASSAANGTSGELLSVCSFSLLEDADMTRILQ